MWVAGNPIIDTEIEENHFQNLFSCPTQTQERMDKKPVVTYVVGNFEAVVFVKVLSILLLIIFGLTLLGSYLMKSSLQEVIENQGLYRFILLPITLAAGIAYLTRHSTLKITHMGKRKIGKLIRETIEKEGYKLKKDKDQMMTFVPEDGGIVSLNQWMENVRITVRFKNHHMTLVGPRRIARNIYDKVRFGADFREVLRTNEPTQ